MLLLSALLRKVKKSRVRIYSQFSVALPASSLHLIVGIPIIFLSLDCVLFYFGYAYSSIWSEPVFCVSSRAYWV